MYGKSAAESPGRIVCLSAEHVEICYALGAGDRVVGVPGTATRPAEARDKPRVGGFTSFRIDRIVQLEPELVLAFSDLQADVTAELLRAGLTVLCTNQRSVDDIFRTVLVVGGALGLADRARSGWEGVSAVRDGEIHPLDGADILSPGPAVLGGLRQIHEIVQAFQAKSGEV